jgi:multiple sugar transport system permease protein
MATQPETERTALATANERLTSLYTRLVKAGVARAGIYFVLALYLFWTLFPVYWMLSGTLKTRRELLATPPYWIPPNPTLQNWIDLFTVRESFHLYIINSAAITIGTTVFAVAVGTMATYGLVKFDFPREAGRFWLPFGTLATRFLPPIIMVIPLFIIFGNIGILDSWLVLILSYSAFTIPFVVWMMVGFFKELPDSIVEAAILDGHTHFGAFFKIVLPLVKPGLIASTIFVLITAWNELLFAVILTQTLDAQTLPVALATFEEQFQTNWRLLTVASSIAMLPPMAFAFLVRDQLVRGFTMGAVN